MPSKRREKGEGSYYQVKGEWFAALVVDGQRVVRRAKNAKDAREKIKELIRLRDSGVGLRSKKETVKEFLDTWMQEVVKQTTRPKTQLFYGSIIKLYLTPAMGSMPLEKVNPVVVLKMMNALRQKLSPRNLRHVHVTGKLAFKQAVRWGRIEKNPFEMLDAPRVTLVEQPYFTRDQARALLAAVEGHRLSILYHLLFALGCRRGEVLGLKYSDINYDEATITIARQVTLANGHMFIDKPKTDAGIRTLPVPTRLLAMLREHQQQSNGAVFIAPSKKGIQTHPDVFAVHFRNAIVRAGLPKELHPHAARHGVATWLGETGINEVTVSGILGHSRASGTVTGMYTHATISAMRIALEAVNTLLYDEK